MLRYSGLIRNQNRISVIATINDDVENILIHCGFKIISNRKDVADDGFESFGYIMLLVFKDNGNPSNGILYMAEAKGRIIFYYTKLIL